MSATILAPVRAATVQASAVRFSAAGDVTFQASAPVIGPTSHIVMLQAVAADSTDRPAAHIVIRTRSGEQRLAEGRSVAMAVGNGNVPDAGRMEIRVERPVRDRAGDRLRARLSYLVVSGT